MDRKTALEILGLEEGATPEEINRRMNVLLKKYRQTERDEKGYTLEDIDKAYKIASGISVYDPEEEKKKQFRKQHPNPLSRLLKIDEEKAGNFFYYYKWHVAIALIVIVAVIYTIVSLTTRVEPDLKVIVTGNLLLPDTELLEERIENEMDGVSEALVQNVYMGAKDPQLQAAMQVKFVTEVTAGDNDIFIMDEECYRSLAVQGAFIPVEELLGSLERLGVHKEDYEDLIVEVKLSDGSSLIPALYGLDVTDSEILKEAGLSGDRIIASFARSGKETEKAVEFVKLMVK